MRSAYVLGLHWISLSPWIHPRSSFCGWHFVCLFPTVITLFLKVSYWILIFLIFIGFVVIILLFCETWDLSSLTRNPAHTLCLGRRSLNHWITREVLEFLFLIDIISTCRPKPPKHKKVSNEKFIVFLPLIKSFSLSLIFAHVALCILFFTLVISFIFMYLFYSILVYWFPNGQIPGHPVEPQV